MKGVKKCRCVASGENLLEVVGSCNSKEGEGSQPKEGKSGNCELKVIFGEEERSESSA